MYTQLHIGTKLKKDLPVDVLDILNYMTSKEEHKTEPKILPQHPLFETDRWHWMLRCGSYYFNYKNHCRFDFDEIGQHYWLNITTSLKDYNDEIAKFLDWISDYLDDNIAMLDEFVGYVRYEEDDHSTLIYSGRMKMKNETHS